MVLLLSISLLSAIPIVGAEASRTIYVVTNTNSTGAGSLRQAILDANGHSGYDYIYFDIPTTDPGYDSVLGVWFIDLTIVLPMLEDLDGLGIYGSTQPGTHPYLPGVILRGTSLPPGSDIFIIRNGSNTINGLGIFNSQGDGIEVDSDTNVIEYNQIFISERYGINLVADALKNYAHDNHICGQKLDGIHLADTSVNTISYNLIGLQPDYLPSVPVTVGNGISLSGCEINSISNNTIGSNGGHGISLSSSDDNLIELNTIGLNVDKDEERGNGNHGIYITGSKGNMIYDNWISGNLSDGIRLEGSLTSGTKIERNKIGTSMHGSAPNHHHGIGIYNGAHDNYVGRIDNLSYYNVIAYNQWSGIVVVNESFLDVGYNFIGTNNIYYNQFFGVHIRNSKGNQIILNKISGNGMAEGNAGVRIENDTGFPDVADLNLIEYNGIDNNAGLGIQLVGDANANILPPTLSSASCFQVEGSAACGGCFVQIFSDYQDEGRVYEDTVTTDSSGNFEWTGLLTGPNVTATLIDTAGNSSQFSTPIYNACLFSHFYYIPMISR